MPDVPVTFSITLSDIQVGVTLLQAVMFGIYDANKGAEEAEDPKDQIAHQVISFRLQEVEKELRRCGFRSEILDGPDNSLT